MSVANIGISTGSGDRVLHDESDIILLDDNLGSIISIVEEGRLMFHNLIKSLAYSLTSSVPKVMPFVIEAVLQIPLPITLPLVLCIDFITDLLPSVVIASYEKPEYDVCESWPRNPKIDKCVTKRLLSHSYLQIGFIQMLAGLFTYFYIMNDYGFTP